jgi:hypothetical protein
VGNIYCIRCGDHKELSSSVCHITHLSDDSGKLAEWM